MKRVFLLALGLSCCAGTAYASTPSSEGGASARGYFTRPASASSRTAFLATQSNPQIVPIFSSAHRRGKEDGLADLALKISYVGSVLLTADQIVRSVDSVLGSMEINGHDGTRLRFVMEPGSRGVDVMLKLNRPFDF